MQFSSQTCEAVALCFTTYCNYNDTATIHIFFVLLYLVLLHDYKFLSEKHLCFIVVIIIIYSHC